MDLPCDLLQRGVAGFHPGSFGAVMGTGVIAIIASTDPGHVAALGDTMTDESYAAAALAGALAVLLGIPYLARRVIYPRKAWADLADPTIGLLHDTFPGGILVLAAVTTTVGPKVLPVHSVPTVIEVLDGIGIPLALAISLMFAYLLFTLEHEDTRVVNGGWFIPRVVPIIVPVVLVPLLSQVGSPARSTFGAGSGVSARTRVCQTWGRRPGRRAGRARTTFTNRSEVTGNRRQPLRRGPQGSGDAYTGSGMGSEPPPWTILFYRDAGGSEPVREWLEDLEKTSRVSTRQCDTTSIYWKSSA